MSDKEIKIKRYKSSIGFCGQSFENVVLFTRDNGGDWCKFHEAKKTIRQQQEVIEELASLLRDISNSNCSTSEFYDECNDLLSKLNGGKK